MIGQRSGSVVPTTWDQDFEDYGVLAERAPGTIGILQLDYGDYEQDFADSIGYRVDPDTQQIIFLYPNKDEDGIGS
ncbi:hypothetical protein ACFOQM_03800 [Paenibacillus sp. GCM10012307]|uniref:Uncharacterized protein n=1 Tax=Paenibacillus roseus TaxID=2798579 RepID=A0A934J2L4_9BACL|nr:hypothetical protein [Paenibacillus roseus]MBJ6360439.1 hypothetical protein [Paenibacillus roseus]